MASPADLGYDLLPPDPGLLNPDLQLEAALAPVINLGTPDLTPLGRGWSYDFVARQFVRNGAAPAGVSGIDQLRMWVEKTLRTARYAHPIYTNVFGMPDPSRLIGEPFDPGLVADWQQQVVDALTVHDRIAAVDEFTFEHDPNDEAVYVSFIVTLDSDDDEQTLSVSSFPLSQVGA